MSERQQRFSPYEGLIEVARDLSAALESKARYTRLLHAAQRVVRSDSACLMRLLEDGTLAPLAVRGLSPDTFGRRFAPSEHPRLAALLQSAQPVLFPADDARPDPFDGLVSVDPTSYHSVHSCMGAALRDGEQTLGVLTFDALEPGRFEDVDLRTVGAFASLAAVALKTAELIDRLEAHAEDRGAVAQSMVEEELRRRGGGILGDSELTRRLRDEVALVADADLSVLITGETGTGKELVARSIHAHSRRKHAPLVYVNCAALPETLAESELFGHVEGAFTGAIKRRKGKFQLAHEATLFLDEVGELPPAIQTKLLRALQFGEVQAVGADDTRSVDVRVIAATNRDLDGEVEAGRFRSDLLHRLNAFPIHVAPLRERPEDIPVLVGHFLERTKVTLGVTSARMSAAALALLCRQSWPGNVRELGHCVTRAVLRARASNREPTVVEPHHLASAGEEERPVTSTEPARTETGLRADETLSDAVDRYKRSVIQAVLVETEGCWAEAARRLQTDRGNLQRTAKRLGIR